MGLNVLSCSNLFSPREGAKAASARESEEHAPLGGHLPPPRSTLCPLDDVSQPSSAMQVPFHSLLRGQATFQAQDGGGGLFPVVAQQLQQKGMVLPSPSAQSRGNKEPQALLSSE